MKFSIVTPAYNSEKFIAETIESVISQRGNFEIEYIVADGGSTDKTVNIIKKYERLIKEGSFLTKCNKVNFKWFSKKDRGMYDAINKGFELASGDVYAWINSDDKYLPGAFNIMQKAFEKYPQIRWLKGDIAIIDEESLLKKLFPCFLYERGWIEKGIYNGVDAPIINQEGVFWRSGLWKKVGGIDPNLKLAGDYSLWIRFAKYEKLYSINASVSCFRRHSSQLSRDIMAYRRECMQICNYNDFPKKKLKLYFNYLAGIHFLRPFMYKLLFGHQDLNFIEIEDNDGLVLKKGSFIWDLNPCVSVFHCISPSVNTEG